MSIIVKGMEIPKNCWECIQLGFRTAIGCTEWTKISAGRCETERAYSCPIAVLPDKHGRLVDADESEKYFWEHLDDNGMAGAMNAINDMPTIVEAEDEP